MQEMTFPGFKFQYAWYIGHTRGLQPLLSPPNILSHRKAPFQKNAPPPHGKILKKGPALKQDGRHRYLLFFITMKFVNYLAIPSKPFALVFDFSALALCFGTTLIEIAVYI
jgi:hypothetical protein